MTLLGPGPLPGCAGLAVLIGDRVAEGPETEIRYLGLILHLLREFPKLYRTHHTIFKRKHMMESVNTYFLTSTQHAPNNKSLPVLHYKNVLPQPLTEETVTSFMTAHKWEKRVSKNYLSCVN